MKYTTLLNRDDPPKIPRDPDSDSAFDRGPGDVGLPFLLSAPAVERRNSPGQRRLPDPPKATRRRERRTAKRQFSRAWDLVSSHGANSPQPAAPALLPLPLSTPGLSAHSSWSVQPWSPRSAKPDFQLTHPPCTAPASQKECSKLSHELRGWQRRRRFSVHFRAL